MKLQYHNKEIWNDPYNNKQDTKHNNVNTNDDVDTRHFDDRVAHLNMHLITRTLGSSSERISQSSPFHPCVRWLFLFDSPYSTHYFPAVLLSVFLFTFFHLSDEQQPELDKKDMENQCDSAHNGGEDTNSVTANRLLSPTGGVNSIHPITEKWFWKLYDENNGIGESNENKCATNNSIITNNWNDANNMQLTKHDTNGDVEQCTCTSTDAWRTCTETARASLFQSLMMTTHTLMAQDLSAFHIHP